MVVFAWVGGVVINTLRQRRNISATERGSRVRSVNDAASCAVRVIL